jgi:hypothetical protein
MSHPKCFTFNDKTIILNPGNCFNLNGEKRGLAVGSVEDGFDEKDVDAPVEKASNLFAVCFHKFVKGYKRLFFNIRYIIRVIFIEWT